MKPEGRRHCAFPEEVLYGIHPVSEALKAGRRAFAALYLERATGGRLGALATLAQQAGVSVVPASPDELARLCGSSHHQGVAAKVSAFALTDLDDIPGLSGPTPLLLLLDGILDPQNLGAIVRTALCTGVNGIVIPKDRSARPTPAVARASAGALEHIRMASVTNLARAINDLKAQGLWVVGLAPQAPTAVFDADLTLPLALVVGAEEKGIRPLVQAGCDLMVSIPQAGPLGSFNASVAAAVVMAEAMRQRGMAKR